MAGTRTFRRCMVSYAVLASLPLGAVLALAMPPLDADLNSPLALWFRGLKSPETGAGCCDLSDCRVTQARWTGSAWEARRPNGGWTPVPQVRTLADKAHPAGEAVLCWRPEVGVICFVPPRAIW